jgi:hypothetical protein
MNFIAVRLLTFVIFPISLPLPFLSRLSMPNSCSLEHMVTSLKSPSTNTNHYNNHANTANKPSSSSDFLQPQQHQLQIQINGGDPKRRSAEQNVSTPTGAQTTGKLMSPKTAKASQVLLSSATGPVTDL